MPTVAVFHPGLDATLYNIVTLAWVLSFFVEMAIIRSAGQRSTTFRADRGSGLFILVSIFVSISIANLHRRGGDRPAPEELVLPRTGDDGLGHRL